MIFCIPLRLEKYFGLYFNGHKNISMIIRLCVVFSLLFVTAAGAYIYRYVDDNGVECFTDSPVNKKAVRIMKDTPLHRKSTPVERTKSGKHDHGKKKTYVTASDNGVSDKSGLAVNLPVQGRITSLVGLRHDPFDGTLRFHNGIDIAIPEGTPVKPIESGLVIFSGCRSGYGNMIIVEHPDGMRTIYAHNSANLARAGEQVDKDTVIAFSGSTGRSTGPHLHFEAWKDDINVTSDFLAYSGEEQTRPVFHRTARKHSPVRTAVLPDGSILFTNLPYVHP
jgi:murein DD-endopeptidase MepM/ murein hydrolase activator NlpD